MDAEGEKKRFFQGDELFITPSGTIHWNQDPFNRCFNQSMGSGILALATAQWPAKAGPSSFFLRSLFQEALTRLAHSQANHPDDDGCALNSLVPSRELALKILERVPPMKGGEYLTPALLVKWHEILRAHIGNELQKRDEGISQWISNLGSPWNKIGRVFFHLAENRDDHTGSHPFAFLATFAHKSSTGGELSHLPLGRAVQLYHDDHAALLAVLQPLKKASGPNPFLREMLADRSIYSPMAWNGRQALAFLKAIPEIEQSGIIVRIVNLWKKPPPKLQVTVTAEQEEEGEKKFTVNSLLSFSVAATLGGSYLSPEDLKALLESDGGLLRFHGEWIEADPVKIRQLLDQWQKASSLMNRLGIPLVQGLRLLVNGPGASLPDIPAPEPECEFSMGEKLRESLKLLREQPGMPPLVLEDRLERIMRPYQREGVSFLERTTSLGFGACLADDMGLGKTVQCLAWLSSINNSEQNAPFLIVAPASLLGNWEEEIQKFTPGLTSAILHPGHLNKTAWRKLETAPQTWLKPYDIVITTYGMTTRLPWLKETVFPALVLDEAQAVKNADSQRSSSIRSLKAERIVALSGTPVENSLSELWSLMDIINPGLLGGRKEFDHFIKGLGEDFSPLRKLVHPFILRRMKTDPELVPDLPDKTEVNAYCHLTPHQAALYKSQVDALHAVLDEPDPAQRIMLILPFLAKFKQICNHPSQFLGRGGYPVQDSGKFIRLEELASSIAERQEKLIIFTQFRSMMDPLHHLLSEIYGRPGLMLHGGTPVPQRQALVADFQQEEGPPYFVLSLKAAGTGLTLTQASHVIHFDRWWNPAVENQATDRAYRIGQHRNVLVHRFICKGTIEDRIDAMLREKQALADSLFEGGIEQLLYHMTPDEIMRLVEGT